MKNRNKKCGECQNWVKWPEDGLCEEFDMRCNSGHKACSYWKAKPYKRDKKIINELLSIGLKNLK